MKAISVRQPFATRLVRGTKPYEYRSWPTKFRGPVLIHASRTPFAGEVPIAKHERKLPLGAIVGAVTIIDCIRLAEGVDNEWGFAVGKFIECEPIPIRGALGFFSVDRLDIRKMPSELIDFFAANKVGDK